MLNIPGTVLFARPIILKKKFDRKEPGSIFVFSEEITGFCYPLYENIFSKLDSHANTRPIANLNGFLIYYGEACMLLDYSCAFKSQNKKIMSLKLFWDSKIVYYYGTKKSVEKRFALPDTWFNRNHIEKLSHFKENGLYEELKTKCTQYNLKTS